MDREKYSDSWTQIAVLQAAFMPIIIIVWLVLNGAGPLLLVMWALSAAALIPTGAGMAIMCPKVCSGKIGYPARWLTLALWSGRLYAVGISVLMVELVITWSPNV